MEKITINPKIMHGKPVIKGTRVPVDVIIQIYNKFIKEI